MASPLGSLLASARDGAIVHVRADLGGFAVTGRDRLAWLNGLVTQDVGKLAPGAGAYGLAVGKTGKIMAELWFVAAAPPGDRVIVVVDRGREALLREHFDRHLVMEDAEVGPSLDRGVIFAHGARARDLVTEARAHGADGAMIDWTGRGDAAVILAPEGGLDATIEALRGAGGVPVTEAEWEAVRIAWGVPRFGADFDDQSLPQEASLEKTAVSFSKGCYLGQESVFMLEKRGHAKKKLVRLAVEGDADLPAGVEIVLSEGGDPAGAVTSATRAPGSDGWLALGSLKHKYTGGGASLMVAGRAAHVVGAEPPEGRPGASPGDPAG